MRVTTGTTTGATTTTHEPRFSMLQRKAQDAAHAEWQYRLTLQVKYGSGHVHYAKTAEQKRLDVLRRATNRAQDRLFVELAKISPRDWSRYVPCRWIVETLTYSDACTAGQLSVTPECAWGATVDDLQRFAAPVPSTGGDRE